MAAAMPSELKKKKKKSWLSDESEAIWNLTTSSSSNYSHKFNMHII